MQADFNRSFTDPFGNPIADREGRPQMINKILGLELFNLGDLGKEPLSQEQKYMAYTLSLRLANATGPVEISPEEAQFIDQVAARAYKAGAYGNIKSILNGE